MITPRERHELRYSTDHEGYFWEIWIPNPAPQLMPDGTPNVLDQYLVETGYARRRRTAEHRMRRAKRRIYRKIAKSPLTDRDESVLFARAETRTDK